MAAFAGYGRMVFRPSKAFRMAVPFRVRIVSRPRLRYNPGPASAMH